MKLEMLSDVKKIRPRNRVKIRVTLGRIGPGSRGTCLFINKGVTMFGMCVLQEDETPLDGVHSI